MQKTNIDTTTIKWVQKNSEIRKRNQKASAYSKSVQRNHKANLKHKACVAFATLACFATFAYVTVDAFELQSLKAADVVEAEQEYIIRYGNIDGYCDNGDMIIVTEDGNEWIVQDAPCYPNGTELRILFDSNATTIETDDVIIDITER